MFPFVFAFFCSFHYLVFFEYAKTRNVAYPKLGSYRFGSATVTFMTHYLRRLFPSRQLLQQSSISYCIKCNSKLTAQQNRRRYRLAWSKTIVIAASRCMCPLTILLCPQGTRQNLSVTFTDCYRPQSFFETRNGRMKLSTLLLSGVFIAPECESRNKKPIRDVIIAESYSACFVQNSRFAHATPTETAGLGF